MRPTSPVLNHPSAENSSRVFSSSRQYPANTFGPLTSRVPTTSGSKFDRTVFRVPHAQRNSFQGRTDRTRQSHAIIGIGCVHHGFRHAIALQNHMPRALQKFPVSFRQQRRRTRNKQAHRRSRTSIQTSLLQQARVVRRHAHVNRGLGKMLERLSRIEFGEPAAGSISKREPC